MDLASKVEFLKFHQGYVRGVAFSPVVRFQVINTKCFHFKLTALGSTRIRFAVSSVVDERMWLMLFFPPLGSILVLLWCV